MSLKPDWLLRDVKWKTGLILKAEKLEEELMVTSIKPSAKTILKRKNLP